MYLWDDTSRFTSDQNLSEIYKTPFAKFGTWKIWQMFDKIFFSEETESS